MATKKKQTLRNSEYYDMQSTFDELYAKSQNGQVFQNLMGIICSEENIQLAYRNIKRNGGSVTPGVDGITIRDIEQMPAEKYILKDYKNFTLFRMRRNGYVSLPKGTDVNRLSKSYSMTKNLAGLPLLTITYSYNGHEVGTARYYQTRLLSDELL